MNKPRQVRRLIDIDTPCPSAIIFANDLTKLCKPEVQSVSSSLNSLNNSFITSSLNPKSRRLFGEDPRTSIILTPALAEIIRTATSVRLIIPVIPPLT